MANRHFLLLTVIVFLVSIICAPHAHALMYPWGSNTHHKGTSDQSDSQSTTPDGDTEWPLSESMGDNDPYGFEPPYAYPPSEPIGEPVGSAPEPLTLVLLGTALTGLGVRQWRRSKRS